MIKLEDITLEDIKNLERIVKFKVAGGAEVKMIQNFIRKYIDHSCHVCPHCDGQIRFAWKRVMNYYAKNKSFIEAKKEELENPKPACKMCGKDLDDKRRKYCSDECKREFSR